MSIIPLAILFGEYAFAAGALAWGVEHGSHPSHASTAAASDDTNPSEDPDSGVAPDDDGPANPDGGIIPESRVPVDWQVGPFDTHQSLIMLELRRQWAILRRAWVRTARHIPWMSITAIIGVYRGYHIFLSVREAVALRRATLALAQGRGVPHDTPLQVRRMMYLARVGINQQVRRGVKRVAGRDPFSTPPPS